MSHHGPIYNPYGAYELKRKYRRNLVVADLSVLGLAALLLGIAWATGQLDRHETVTITRNDADRSVHVITALLEPVKPVKRNVTAPRPKVPKDLGIRDNILIDPDPLESRQFDPTQIYSDTTSGRNDSLQSYADAIGNREVGGYSSADRSTDTITEHIILPCSVLVAVKPEYPWVARERHKEGVAGLIVCVGASGKVTQFSAEVVQEFEAQHLTVEKMTVRADGQRYSFNYVVTLEEPSGWFFARKVAEVLPKWVFAPSTVDGEVVPTLIPVGHAFCLTGECDKAYIELRRYKRFGADGSH